MSGSSVRGGEEGEEQGSKWEVAAWGEAVWVGPGTLRRDELGGDEEMPKWRNERTCKLGGRFPLKGLASKHFQRYDLTSRAQNQLVHFTALKSQHSSSLLQRKGIDPKKQTYVFVLLHRLHMGT